MGLRGGESETAHALDEVGDDAATMRSLGHAAFQAEQVHLEQLRQRLLERAPLDKVDQAHLARLQQEPCNLAAIKSHAAALLCHWHAAALQQLCCSAAFLLLLCCCSAAAGLQLFCCYAPAAVLLLCCC